jgi:hypothetical protein
MATPNKIDHPDSFEKFSPWFDKFLKRNGGWSPHNIKRWFDAVDKQHEGLRRLIGGVRKEGVLNLKSQQTPLNMRDAEPVINRILQILPDYLASYSFTKEAFLYPTIQQGTHSGFRLTKHVKTYADMQAKNGVINKATIKDLEGLLSSLGALWNKARTSDIELESTFSTSAKGFALLGHYGPDQDSCFRNGSDKTADKFVLGQSKDTFVISISKFNTEKDKWTNVARCFGFTSPDYRVFNICNPYMTPGFMEGDAIEAFRQTIQNIVGEECELHDDQIIIYDRVVYHNPYGRWSFTKGKGSRLTEPQVLSADINLIKAFSCPHCLGNARSDVGWEEIDNVYVCPSCVRRAQVCGLSGRKTFSELVEALDKNNRLVYVHHEVALEMIRCDGCRIPHLQTTTLNSTNLCSECVDATCSVCDGCDKLINDSDISDFGTRDYCNTCLEAGLLPFEEEEIDFIIDQTEHFNIRS